MGLPYRNLSIMVLMVEEDALPTLLRTSVAADAATVAEGSAACRTGSVVLDAALILAWQSYTNS
jgi:hypothetical protein